MSDNSSIEWTDATWNPATGCTQISRGCERCYALRFSERFRGVKGHPFEQGFDLRLWPGRLHQPLEWKRPRRIFVNSMSDLFHKDIPKTFISEVFDTMEKADWHTYQILTKRSNLMRDFVNERYGQAHCPPHIWLGVSVEDRMSLSRVEHLRQARAEVRFISVEPLLGPVGRMNLEGINWVIVGGESGPRFRPMEAQWAREVRDQCVETGIALFFKQWGGRWPKAGGNLLDGKVWAQFPDVRSVQSTAS